MSLCLIVLSFFIVDIVELKLLRFAQAQAQAEPPAPEACRRTHVILITEVSEVMKPMHRNGLKGHQHIAQGIALGRRTIVKFALKGHKPYHASLCFCPCRAPLLRFALTQDDALGWELYGLPGRPAELPKLQLNTELSEVKMEVKMEVNSLHSWKLKWTRVNEAASIQGYRPARSALLPASNAGVTSYLTSSYNFRNLNKIKKNTASLPELRTTSSLFVH